MRERAGTRRVPGAAVAAMALCLVAGTPAAADVASALEASLDAARVATRAEAGGELFDALQRFYVARSFRPLWIADAGPTGAARALADVLAHAADDGLEPADYRVAEIGRGLDRRDDAALADLELLLSHGLVRYGRDLSAGRVSPSRADPEHHLEPEAAPAEALLSQAGNDDVGTYLATLAPRSREYARLKAALAAHRAIAAAGGWGTVPAGETLKPGMRDPRVAALRRRLAGSGDIAVQAAEPELYDDALKAAVRHFQYRHGLGVDGAVGKGTLTALNVPVEARIEQILLNMERRRWMTDEPGESYVFVNLADFTLKLVNGERTILDMRVVVGKPYHRTPVFSDLMRYIVVNPYWTVPPSIARNEILPKLRQEPDYLAKQNMKLFADWTASSGEIQPGSVDWSKVSKAGFGYKLRQEPGEGNALGRLKFMFPNRFNIYLHDTPSRQLFKQTVRSFSHGCIRVEQPVRLAATLLRGQKGWSEAEIEAAIGSGERLVVNLAKPLPVHITYLTAWVNKDGSAHFRDDIYGRDKRLARALAGA
jgi:murein L,D-transpeptidase YcbB/YkuD